MRWHQTRRWAGSRVALGLSITQRFSMRTYRPRLVETYPSALQLTSFAVLVCSSSLRLFLGCLQFLIPWGSSDLHTWTTVSLTDAYFLALFFTEWSLSSISGAVGLFSTLITVISTVPLCGYYGDINGPFKHPAKVGTLPQICIV